MTLPATTFAEKSGTFTNYAGRVQRILAAIEPPPGCLTDGEVFTRLLNLHWLARRTVRPCRSLVADRRVLPAILRPVAGSAGS